MNINRQAYYHASKLLPFQSSQPLIRIFNLSNARVSVFPEFEEFLVMLYGFGSFAFQALPFILHSGRFMRRRRSFKRGSSRRLSKIGRPRKGALGSRASTALSSQSKALSFFPARARAHIRWLQSRYLHLLSLNLFQKSFSCSY